MSPWLRDELRIAVCPEWVALLRIERRLTRRGLSRHLRDKDIRPGGDDGADAPLWSGALKTLEQALAAPGERKPVAAVTLSNHFVRYALVPWSELVNDEEEEIALARHCFREVYGEAADQWELRLSADDSGAPRLASAVDVALLESLRGVFDQAGVALKSVQPHLMAVYNACRPQLGKRTGWLALVETGTLTLALLKEGRVVRLRTLRLGGDWREELTTALERESYLAETDSRNVYLWAPGAFHEHGSWRVQSLQTAARPGFTVSYDGQFSMAMGG